MPDAYTHVRTAKKALMKSDIPIFDLEAFGAGANGPDPFFFYKVWQKDPKPDMYSLSTRLHNEKTGEFLLSLIKNAQTPTQRSYVLGFLTHYAVDTLAHPYVAFLTREGGEYDYPKGHPYYESELSSAQHYLDYGTTTVSAEHAIPLPNNAKLYQICDLLETCLLEVYNRSISIGVLMESFHNMRFVKTMLVSNLGVRRKGYSLIEKYVFNQPGYILSMTTPVKTNTKVPDVWQNIYQNNKEYTGGMKAILAQAIKKSITLMKKADEYWRDEIALNDCAQIIGNKSYETGEEIR